MATIDENLRRVPPQSLEAEESVLGGILLDNTALDRVLELIQPDDFYRGTHRRIFRTMLELSERNEPVDLLTLSEALRARGELAEVGGSSFLAALAERVPTAANIAYYARIVRDRSLLRSLITASTEIATRGYDAPGNVGELLDRAEQLIFGISERQVRLSFSKIADVLVGSLKTIERLYEQKQAVTGVATGFADLDGLTAGLQPSDLIVVAGRPSMGKTAFVLCVAEHAALRADVGVAIFSLEMAKEQLAMRMLCSEARVDLARVRTGHLSDREFPKLAMAAGRLADAPIYIDDTPALSVLELRAKARRLKRDPSAKLGLVIVDYIQLMRGAEGRDNREQEISEISRSLKALAKELEVPVVALSQLNRQVESRNPPIPRLADLRECVTGDTLVLLADGRRVPMAQLVGTEPNVLALSREGRIVEAHSDKVWRVGVRPVFRIGLASGRSVTATAQHRLLSGRGWRRVEHLAVGDRIAAGRSVPEPADPVVWPDGHVILLGHLIGDGSYLKGQPLRYTTSSEDNSAEVAASARDCFGTIVRRYDGRGSWHQLLLSSNGNRWQPAGVNAWLRALGVFGQRSHEKRIPVEAFRLSNKQIGLLLRHLWATDGCIWTPPAGQRHASRVYYGTTSEGLAADVSALLLRLGITARLHRVPQRTRMGYAVSVSGADHQRCFLERVGAFGPRKPHADRLAALLVTASANTNVDTLPRERFALVKDAMQRRGVSQRAIASLRGTAYGGTAHFRFAPSRAMLAEYAHILEDPALLAEAESDVFWDRIVTLEPAGEAEVFDLTVPGPGCWLADGIVSHNSGAIEQDADVILFLYREEYYVEDTDKRGVAEVIVAKQRNGPVGQVELTFLKEFTRFENREVAPEDMLEGGPGTPDRPAPF
jgi:replicative DNA helicase